MQTMTLKQVFKLIGHKVDVHIEIDRFVEIRTSKAIMNFNNVSGYAYIEMFNGNEYRIKIVY